jgi:hypothetical protein
MAGVAALLVAEGLAVSLADGLALGTGVITGGTAV